VQPDGRLKDPAKVAESIRERTLERSSILAKSSLAGLVTDIAVATCQGCACHNLDGDKGLESLKALAELLTSFNDTGNRFIGVNVANVLKVILTQFASAGIRGSFYRVIHDAEKFDPVVWLYGGAEDRYLDYSFIARRAHESYREELSRLFNGWEPHQDSYTDIQIAKIVSEAFGFVSCSCKNEKCFMPANEDLKKSEKPVKRDLELEALVNQAAGEILK